MARSALLGTPKTVELPQGVVGYRDVGSGPPVVFVHGGLVNADLWRKVVPGVAAAGHRCLSPDWPLGSHEIALRPGADVSPTGLADLIGDFLDTLDLDDVTLVGNDSGGALVQLLMARRPDRIGQVVLASCDALERFFAPPFQLLPIVARLPGSTWLLAQLMWPRPLRRLPITYGWLSRRPIPNEVLDCYLRPMRRDAGVRRDLRGFLRGVNRRHTLAAARSFGSFTRPVLLAWAENDRLFPMSLARRLADLLPNARVVPVPDSATYIPEDQPDALAELIVEFVGAPRP
jgi:pimeloyl-ACP methyl ester carboxylesterase